MSPEALQKFWLAKLERCIDEKPPEVEEEEPEAYKVFHSDFWNGTEAGKAAGFEGPTPQLNLAYYYYKWVMPQLCGKNPTPACKTAHRSNQKADLHNQLKAYSDKECNHLSHHKRVTTDAFLRGTGASYTYKDPKKGIARTVYVPIRDLYIDPQASCIEEAQYIIQRLQCTRWEFAERFGYEIARKMKPCQDKEEGSNEANLGDDTSTKFADIIEYCLAWSKYEGYRRVYAFVRQQGSEDSEAEYINTDDEGRPGEPWAYDFGEEDWPFTFLTLTPENDQPWGLSYYRACKGPIGYVNFFASYILQAAAKSAKQTVLYPEGMGQVMQKIASSSKHLECVGYDHMQLRGRTPKEMVHVVEYPPLSSALQQGLSQAINFHDLISGVNAVAQMDPSGVETAAEAVNMSESGENRVSHDRKQVEEYLEHCWAKEVQINYALTKRRSAVRVFMPGEEPEDSYDGENPQKEKLATGVFASEAEDEELGGEIKADIPWETARYLIREIKDPAAAQQQAEIFTQLQAALQQLQPVAMQAQQFMAQMQVPPDQPPPSPTGDPMMDQGMMQQAQQAMMAVQQTQQQIQQIDPKVRARVEMQIPMEAKVELVEPGVEAFLSDPNLSALWEEGMSPWEVAAELTLQIEQGSTRHLGHMMEFNEAAIVYKTLIEFFVAWQMPEKIAELHNYLIDSLDKQRSAGLKITAEELQQSMQQVFQQQMQMAQAGGVDLEDKHKKAMELENTKAKHSKESDERRGSREKSRTEDKLALAAVGK